MHFHDQYEIMDLGNKITNIFIEITIISQNTINNLISLSFLLAVFFFTLFSMHITCEITSVILDKLIPCSSCDANAWGAKQCGAVCISGTAHCVASTAITILADCHLPAYTTQYLELPHIFEIVCYSTCPCE